MADYRRARWGLRRTFQTEQAIEALSVYDNVAMIHEHSGASAYVAARRRARARSSSSGSTCRPKTKVGGLGARERRLVEVARAVVGKPRVVLLDEPAAGLPDQETGHLGEVIRKIPEQFGALVILVDHDMSLVSACCETTAVLDFGKLIASGPDGGGAPERARDPRVPRHGGRAVSGTGATLTDRRACPVSRGGEDRSCTRSRSRSPPGEVTTLLGAERRRQVDARARGRRACSARPAAASCSATASSRSRRPEQIRAAGRRGRPRGPAAAARR